MILKEKNFAFIDSQNLNLGIQKLGWKLDYKKFRIYLDEKYGVQSAYMFIGFITTNQKLYERLQQAGFILKFKPTVSDADGKIKGNVDADLVLQTMIDFSEYERAVIISSDGDFYSLVSYLHKRDKLKAVLSYDRNNCSILLREAAQDKLQYMYVLRNKLEYTFVPKTKRTA